MVVVVRRAGDLGQRLSIAWQRLQQLHRRRSPLRSVDPVLLQFLLRAFGPSEIAKSISDREIAYRVTFQVRSCLSLSPKVQPVRGMVHVTSPEALFAASMWKLNSYAMDVLSRSFGACSMTTLFCFAADFVHYVIGRRATSSTRGCVEQLAKIGARTAMIIL